MNGPAATTLEDKSRVIVSEPSRARPPALQMPESELLAVLGNSLYPGAAPASIALVLGYCKAAGLDPMMKPVHIVPMWDSKSGSMRDTIMPGIGLYRTQAARSGQYAGITEPEFGPDVTEQIGGVEITYPKWCKVTAKRSLPSGVVAEFSAVERWKENYAVKGGKDKSVAPNAMWYKRPYGQLAKCASAQALRNAFPEMTGAQPTADEMEGKQLDEGQIIEHEQRKPDPGPKPYPDDQFKKNLPAWTKLIQSGKKTAEQIIATVSSKGTLTDAQKKAITDIKRETVETGSLLDEVKRHCAAALGIKDTETAFLKLDDAKILLNEMDPDSRSAAVNEIDNAEKAIKGRK